MSAGFGRGLPWVFEIAAFDADAPEVAVDGVWRFARDGDLDVMRARVVEFFVAALESPFADGCDDVQFGRERGDTGLEADLVVAFSGASVGYGDARVFKGGANQLFCDEGTSDSGVERIAVFVDGVCLERGEDEIADELLAQVEHVGRFGADIERALRGPGEVAGLAEVCQDGDDAVVFLSLEPVDGDGGIQAARIG